MVRNVVNERALEAAVIDARRAVAEFDGARQWLADARQGPMEPLGAEVWVFDEELARVVLVKHRWRGWVPPGGKVEAGETPREGAIRELFEETGLRAELLPEPAAVAVRSYHPDLPVTLGLSYAAILDAATSLVAEAGQPVAWMRLDEGWESCFPDDLSRIRQHAAWMVDRVSRH
ncbi:NUDIX domain-containing protein [Kitasatospora sp. MAP5-34]|uniref:NUDIX domain-containing protein n=1 Tax=Kitasatospora sp. MAP5-34 TaxID=3035102 RepID=UPI002473A4F6|nr:NUDIX domain-containing protein [Kitasatospora sp. MAP5-34]MDH6580688.1 8-oxo-dGTP diphosphatase [Kitasatospora sp. MAP5-34]